MRLEKIEWAGVESSNVQALFYDDKAHTLCVKFNNGGVYSYMTPRETYVGMLNAASVGQYLHHVVKAYPYTRHESEQALLDHLNVAA